MGPTRRPSQVSNNGGVGQASSTRICCPSLRVAHSRWYARDRNPSGRAAALAASRSRHSAQRVLQSLFAARATPAATGSAIQTIRTTTQAIVGDTTGITAVAPEGDTVSIADDTID
jgi:hypothetical protein